MAVEGAGMVQNFPLHELAAESMSELAPAALFDLGGKVALVTGASGGLGSWLAAGLAAAGAHVVATDHPRAELALDGVIELITSSGGLANGISADLLAHNAAEDLIAAVVADHGRIDVLINNAGMNRREPIFEVSDESWDLITRLDLKVPYDLSRAAARDMVTRGEGGAIMHICSLTNAIGLQGVSVYGAQKAGLVQTAKTMAVEWADHGIRVNALCPGFMLTSLSKPLWDDQRRGEWLVRRSPLRRPGYPRELIGATLLLTSEAGSFITGQCLYVDGGYLAGTAWDDVLG
jgi:NAD(P)-dependent dehydrogenase (short-subunit alcohol dehydrogenase family)